jgi:hypothetical protein
MTWTHSLARRVRRGGLTLVAAALLGGCGGGTSQITPFVAERVLAFGDESSHLTPDGRKYSVNALNADDTLACGSQPLWTQAVANLYGLVFAQCNPSAVADPGATQFAAPGNKAADLSAQIDAAEAQFPGFPQRTIATVMMGANDVLELYAQYPARDEADLAAELRTRGELVAQQVNRLVGDGVRVLIATVPDLGFSPFALEEKAAHTDVDRAALLSRLTAAMNTGMRLTIVNDGRKVGLVLADEMVQVLAENPGAFSLSNSTDAACTEALPDCSANTLVEDASSPSYLWADAYRMAFGGQNQLGSLARSRAVNNPF